MCEVLKQTRALGKDRAQIKNPDKILNLGVIK